MSLERRDAGRTIVIATAVAGTLDILGAFAVNAVDGLTPGDVLRLVAAGPFGDGMKSGGAGAAALGALVHYAIMLCMAAFFVTLARKVPLLIRKPLLSGAIYGVLIYLFMYWIVLVNRYPGYRPSLEPWPLANSLFLHIICVGIPIAAIAAVHVRRWQGRRDGVLAS